MNNNAADANFSMWLPCTRKMEINVFQACSVLQIPVPITADAQRITQDSNASARQTTPANFVTGVSATKVTSS